MSIGKNLGEKKRRAGKNGTEGKTVEDLCFFGDRGVFIVGMFLPIAFARIEKTESGAEYFVLRERTREKERHAHDGRAFVYLRRFDFSGRIREEMRQTDDCRFVAVSCLCRRGVSR